MCDCIAWEAKNKSKCLKDISEKGIKGWGLRDELAYRALWSVASPVKPSVFDETDIGGNSLRSEGGYLHTVIKTKSGWNYELTTT